MGCWVGFRTFGENHILCFEKVFKNKTEAEAYNLENSMNLEIQYHPIQGTPSNPDAKRIYVSEAYVRDYDLMDFVGLFHSPAEAEMAYKKRSKKGLVLETNLDSAICNGEKNG